MEHIVVGRATITHYSRDLTRRTLHTEESVTGFYYLRVWLREGQKEKQREEVCCGADQCKKGRPQIKEILQ